jgi:hypothetical protein
MPRVRNEGSGASSPLSSPDVPGPTALSRSGTKAVVMSDAGVQHLLRLTGSVHVLYMYVHE